MLCLQPVPRTCQDLKSVGVSQSGDYMIDPDGPGIGDEPFAVYCNMTSDGETSELQNIVVTSK